MVHNIKSFEAHIVERSGFYQELYTILLYPAVKLVEDVHIIIAIYMVNVSREKNCYGTQK